MKYAYTGWVSDANGKELAQEWHGETTADSPQKAQSNLKYQFNMQINRPPYNKVVFDTKKIVEV